MKTREDLVRMLGVLATTAKLLERDYDAGIVKWKEFVRRRQDIAMQMHVLIYVLVETECFFTSCSIEDAFAKAFKILESEERK